MSRINIEIPNEDHQKLKIFAAISGESIKDLVLAAIKEKIYSGLEKKPNDLTLKAFAEVDSGNGLTTHRSISELFQDLGLDNVDKDLEKAKKQKRKIAILQLIIQLLVKEEVLPIKFRDHKLIGNYKNRRECHIEPDLLLIYSVKDDTLFLERLGSHSELFR
jgi:mRNA interferase YafQ